MEITVSRKSHTQKFAYFVLGAALVVAGYLLYSNGLLSQWFAVRDLPTSSSLAEEPALQALVAFYSPDITREQLEWEDQVCAGMTESGCELFRKMYAPKVWTAAQAVAVNAAGATATFSDSVETLDDGSQVWQVNLTVSEVSEIIYIHVVRNESGKWLLNRVLFDQESAKYQRSSPVDEDK